MGMLTRIEGHNKGSLALMILAIVISAALAVLVASMLFKNIYMAASMMGAVAGFFLGITLYNIAFSWSDSVVALSFLSFGMAAIMALVAFRFFDTVVIMGTSLTGAYGFIRGTSVLAGHYPNEFIMFKQLANGQTPRYEA